MTDNEIMKALECCAYWESDKSCEDCPENTYGFGCGNKLSKHSLDLINRQNSEIERLKQALENQIPKKPKGETDPMFGDVKTVCPSCGNANLVNPFVRSRVYDYCPNCGQALDWSEENGNK